MTAPPKFLPPMGRTIFARQAEIAATFPGLANLADSPAVPFVNYFVKRGKHLWCLKCESMARFLPHSCREDGDR